MGSFDIIGLSQQSAVDLLFNAGMAELADAPDLGSGGNTVQVQVLLPALF